jgi:hypothetical protein
VRDVALLFRAELDAEIDHSADVEDVAAVLADLGR